MDGTDKSGDGYVVKKVLTKSAKKAVAAIYYTTFLIILASFPTTTSEKLKLFPTQASE